MRRALSSAIVRHRGPQANRAHPTLALLQELRSHAEAGTRVGCSLSGIRLHTHSRCRFDGLQTEELPEATREELRNRYVDQKGRPDDILLAKGAAPKLDRAQGVETTSTFAARAPDAQRKRRLSGEARVA